MKNKYMIVISFDAVSCEDLESLRKLPNFSKMIKEGALIKNVDSIYPSLTYPAHATIVTGRYPKNHGVINNTVIDFKHDNPNWYWYSKSINGDTIYDVAENQGLRTCSILWPVSGRSKITYNMPEICCTRNYDNQIIKSAMSGSLIYQFKMNKRFQYLRRGIQQPYLDNFAVEVAKKTIREKKPNLLLLHLVDVDTQKHNYGTKSNEVIKGLERHDKRLGEIIEVLKFTGIYNDSTIIALGDHSQLDVKSAVRLNQILYKNNIIKLKNNKIKSYKAIAKSCDGSVYIYLKNKNDYETKRKIKELLNEFKNQRESPIEEIYEEKEISDLGADTEATFMVEAKEGYYFIDEVLGEIVEEVMSNGNCKIKHKISGAHGYLPFRKNYKTFFIATGKGIKRGVVLESGKLINHGPTIAKLMDLQLDKADGEVEERILNI